MSDPTQPVITSEEGFMVKIKLLSNEVYEIPVSPTTSVADFKKLVQQKTQVPVERQRLVFSGKQLVDGTNIGDYVKESGLTLHLIARSNPPPENTPPTLPTSPQQPQQQQQVPRPPQPQPQQPFGIFNMPNPFLIPQQNPFNMPNPQANPQQQPNPTIFAQNINSAVNNLMGSLGIRLPPPPNAPIVPNQAQQPQQSSQQPQQPQQPQQQPQQPQQSPPAQQPRVVPPPNVNVQMFQPLDQLQQNINRVVIMGEHSNIHANPRVNAINYLRRLQNNMLRFLPQLNRGIQLLQEGRTTHLPDLAEIFESLNASNAGAVQLIRSLNAEQPQHHHHHHQQQVPHVHGPGCNHPHPQQPPQQPPQQQQPMDLQEPEMSATIVISQDGNSNGQFSLQMSTNNPTNAQGESTIMNTLTSFLQPGTGSSFNFANLFAQPLQPQPQAQNLPQQPPQSQSQPQQSSEAQNAQNVQRQPQQIPPQAQQASQPQAAQQNPLGGINMMSIFNNLQQSGGMGALLGMSLGSMLQEEGQPTTVYSAILAPITGSEILACFTQKDFSFISRKRQQFREATLKAISVAGSREDLVNRYAIDLEKMLVPEGSVRNEEVCRKRVAKILHRHIERVIGHFLDSSAELDLTNAVLGELKTMYCQAIEEIGKHSESIESVFGNIKRGFVQCFDQMIPGFSGMLYSIIQRDLLRIYREYITEKKRRQEMSAEEAQDEADLLKRIEAEGREEAQEMAAFEHSSFYPK